MLNLEDLRIVINDLKLKTTTADQILNLQISHLLIPINVTGIVYKCITDT